jgi:hypothetical protein
MTSVAVIVVLSVVPSTRTGSPVVTALAEAGLVPVSYVVVQASLTVTFCPPAVVAFPDAIQDLVLADDSAGGQHQEPQQPALVWRQVDHGPGPPDLVRILVQLEVGDAQPGTGIARPGAPQHRSNAAERLVQAERLGDVVVRAQVEAVDAVGLLVPGGQEDHGDLDADGTHPAKRLEPVPVWHHHIQQNQVRPARRGCTHRLGAACRRGHLEPRQAQRS